MRNIVMTVAVTLVFACAVMVNAGLHGAPNYRSHWLEDFTVINVSDLTENSLTEIMTGEHPELTIEFTKGAQLPINYFLRGDILTLIDNNNPIQAVLVEQTFYARFYKGELLLSTDLADWKSFTNFVSGNIGVSLIIQEGESKTLFAA